MQNQTDPMLHPLQWNGFLQAASGMPSLECHPSLMVSLLGCTGSDVMVFQEVLQGYCICQGFNGV